MFCTVNENSISTFGNDYPILFNCTSVDEVNQFCTDNSDCGVLHEDKETGLIYVCANEPIQKGA
jgi:hypothetical protein